MIASGRFNVPHIPAIQGLGVWQRKFPDKVYHSREYRRADGLEGKTILVVGASASATGISADVNPIAGKSLLSVRVSVQTAETSSHRTFGSSLDRTLATIHERRFDAKSISAPFRQTQRSCLRSKRSVLSATTYRGASSSS